MIKHRIIFTAFVVLTYFFNAFAQDVGERINSNTVTIYNSSDKDLKFKLGSTKNSLKLYSIAAEEKWISPSFSLNSKPLFTIKTKGTEKKYTLALDNEYMIFWNDKKKYWDLKKIKDK